MNNIYIYIYIYIFFFNDKVLNEKIILVTIFLSWSLIIGRLNKLLKDKEVRLQFIRSSHTWNKRVEWAQSSLLKHFPGDCFNIILCFGRQRIFLCLVSWSSRRQFTSMVSHDPFSAVTVNTFNIWSVSFFAGKGSVILLFWLLIGWFGFFDFIIIMSCHRHGYPWPPLATSPYRSSPLASLQGYITYASPVVSYMFGLSDLDSFHDRWQVAV